MGAGSGGATGQTSLEAYQKETHSMLLRGRSFDATITAGKDWAGNAEAEVYANAGSYADNPSVLRFIKEKGITDAGGNPFEGVSAYSTEGDLGNTDTDFAELLADVKALNPLADWDSYVTAALAQVENVIGTLDLETIAEDIVDRAITKASEVMLQNATDAKGIAGDVTLTARNNASSVATEQLSLGVDEGGADGITLSQNADDAAETSISAAINAVNSKVGVITNSNIINAQADADTETAGAVVRGITHADNVIDAGVILANTTAAGEVEDGSNTIAPLASNAINNGGLVATAITNTMEATARDAAKTSMTSVIGAVTPDVDSIVFQAIVGLKSTARDIISEAAQLAFEVVDSEQVTTAVDSYRRRLLKAHLRSVNRFAGGMADVGAVNSSAFIVGMALLESDQQDAVADFQAKLELDLYTQLMTNGMAQYVDTLKSVFAQYMDSYERRFAQTLEVYKSNLSIYAQTFLSVVPEFVRVYLQSFMDYMTTFNSTLGQNSQVVMSSVQLESNASHVYSEVRNRLAGDLTRLQLEVSSRVAALGVGISDKRVELFARNAEQEAGTFERTFASGAQTVLNIANSELGETVRTRLTEKQSKFQYAVNSAQAIVGMQGDKVRLRHASTSLLEQINRARIIASSEEYAKNLLYDVNSSNWDMELYQKAANVLAGVSGAVVAAAGKPSDIQTVLGGMVAGAAVGSLYGATAGAPGMLVGAGIGGVASLIANATD